MSLERVQKHFKKYNIEDKIIVLNESSATVAEAAHALGTKECRIAKTISLMTKEGPILIVVAGNMKIDNAKYKAEFHEKACMLKYDECEKLIGHAPGGVCPFGINDGVNVYLDESLKKYETVYPACGSSNSAIKLAIKELEEYSNSNSWIDVTKEIV